MGEPSLARAKPLLGTMVAIRASHHCPMTLAAAIDKAFAAVARIHQLMSVHQPDSDLSRLNRAAPGIPVELADDTVAVLVFALELAVASNGLFDPSIGGTLSRQGLLPTPARAADPAANWHDLTLSGSRACCQRPLLLDLGGIAKGYAVDAAFRLLQAAGCIEIMINAGGDLRLSVAVPEPIHVRLADDSLLPVLSLTEGAVATSCFHRSGQRDPAAISHLVHPHSGRVQAAASSIVVLAPDCMVADALTKLVALDPVASVPLLKKFAAEAIEIAQNAAGIQVRQWPNRHLLDELDVEDA